MIIVARMIIVAFMIIVPCMIIVCADGYPRREVFADNWSAPGGPVRLQLSYCYQ